MAIPSATLTIQDGQLGLLPQDNSGVQALIGTCSTGTVGEVNTYGTIQAVRTALGVGPLVEAAALVFQYGAGPIICVKATSSTAGAAGSVTHVGTGTSVVTVAGASLDVYSVIVLIKTAAAAITSGLGTFQISLDGGLTYGAEVALPVAGTYLIPNTGLTLTFAAGTLVVSDTYSFTATAPSYDITAMNVAVTALMASTAQFFLVHVIGTPADAAATAAIFAALDTALTTAATNYRYAMACCQSADTTTALMIAAFSALTSVYVAVAYGFADVTSPISLQSYKRGASWVICARAGAVDAGEDLGRVATGSLVGVTRLYFDSASDPSMDSNRFSTLRTHNGIQGFYVCNARIFCTPLSDFRFWQYRRVMNIAAGVVRTGQLQYLNDSIRVNDAGAQLPLVAGGIIEQEASNIEQYLLSLMRASLTTTVPRRASNVSCTVDRSNNIITTSELRIQYGVTPLGYAKTITGVIGFVNPGLTTAQ